MAKQQTYPNIFRGRGLYRVGKYGLGCDSTFKIFKLTDKELEESEHIYKYDIPEGSLVGISQTTVNKRKILRILVLHAGIHTQFDQYHADEGSVYYADIDSAFGSGNIKWLSKKWQ